MLTSPKIQIYLLHIIHGYKIFIYLLIHNIKIQIFFGASKVEIVDSFKILTYSIK